MEFIAHRVNTIEELKKIPQNCGVEIDVRDNNDKLYLSHDPFSNGDDLEEYLQYYNHGIMILNVKSERIEYKCIELLEKYSIKQYFFLDSSIPMIYLLSNSGNTNFAVRFSEIEPIELAIAMKDRAKWIWVDCFSKLPINSVNSKLLKNLGYKICIVSPELQGQQEKIKEYKEYLLKNNITCDAVCSKIYNFSKWQ